MGLDPISLFFYAVDSLLAARQNTSVLETFSLACDHRIRSLLLLGRRSIFEDPNVGGAYQILAKFNFPDDLIDSLSVLYGDVAVA